MKNLNLNAATVAALQNIMDDEVEKGNECGIQLAIYQHGKPVLSLVSGYTDASHSKKVDENSLFPVFSVGKGIMATAFHRLVEKGIISYDTVLADLWPEFACNGKENIRIWQVLSHREALFELPPSNYPEQADWNLMCSRVASMTPAWTPGTICRYHPVTYAWLLGEPAARAAGKSFSQIIHDEVFAPLKIDSFFFGTNAEADARMIKLDLSKLPEPTTWHTDFIGCDEIRHGFVPSANGVGNALSIARHYASLIGEVDGVRLLKPETVEKASTLCRSKDDPLPSNGTWECFGLGYALQNLKGDSARIFGHGGAAGAEGFADKENCIAWGLTRNKLLPTHPRYSLRDRISAELGYSPRHW